MSKKVAVEEVQDHKTSTKSRGRVSFFPLMAKVLVMRLKICIRSITLRRRQSSRQCPFKLDSRDRRGHVTSDNDARTIGITLQAGDREESTQTLVF